MNPDAPELVKQTFMTVQDLKREIQASNRPQYLKDKFTQALNNYFDHVNVIGGLSTQKMDKLLEAMRHIDSNDYKNTQAHYNQSSFKLVELFLSNSKHDNTDLDKMLDNLIIITEKLQSYADTLDVLCQ